MSTKIIPSINVQDFEELKKRLTLLRTFSDWAHLDIASKEFTNFETWQNPVELERLEKSDLKIEVHLMMHVDRNSIRKWLREGVKRIIFHIEAAEEPEQIIKVLKKEKREIGIALNPETPVEKIKPFLKFIDVVTVLGVKPGPSGQEFQKSVLEKYKNIEGVKIEADGGVSRENIAAIAEAGADLIIAGSAIFGAGNPEENLRVLKKLI